MAAFGIEMVRRVNSSQHRLQFTLHHGCEAIQFDVAPGEEIDVPRYFCEPRPSASANRMLPSVLEQIAPHLVPISDAKRAAKGKDKADSGKNDGGIPS